MAYQSTLIAATGMRPSELLMGRRIKTILLTHINELKPKQPNLNKVKEKDAKRRKIYYDKRYGVHNLNPLKIGDKIQIRTDQEKRWKNISMVIATDKQNM